MNAFAVIPCTESPDRAVITVTPVANIPSVRRNAIAGSPSSPAPSSSASASGAASNDAPKASGAEIAVSSATSNSSGGTPGVAPLVSRMTLVAAGTLKIALSRADNRHLGG